MSKTCSEKMMQYCKLILLSVTFIQFTLIGYTQGNVVLSFH